MTSKNQVADGGTRGLFNSSAKCEYVLADYFEVKYNPM